ncbi:MAG: TIGR04086 family membrane protein [Clostridiaceae bacterium]|nr:TIGR04086 family membrane protein [Eubacteriales bacterium]
MKGSKTADTAAAGIWMPILKGALIASACSIALIVLFAVVLKQEWANSDSIPVANSVIKVLSAALAAFIATRKCKKRCWLTGLLAGLIYTLLAFMVFSILSDSFSFSLALLSDMGIGALSGMLTAMLVQMLRR